MCFEGREEADPLVAKDLCVCSVLLRLAFHEGFEEGAAIGRQALSPSVDNPIDLPCSLPVGGVIEAELRTKHAKSSTCLLVSLSLEVEVGQHGELALLLAFPQLPSRHFNGHLMVGHLGSVQAYQERFGAPVKSVKVLNGIHIGHRRGSGAAHFYY